VTVSINAVDPSNIGVLFVGATGEPPAAMIAVGASSTAHASAIVPVDPATGTITVTAVYASIDVSIDVIGSFAQPNDSYRFSYGIDGLRLAKQLDGDTAAGYLWRNEYTWDTASGLPVILAEHRDSQTPLAASGTSYLIYGPGGMPIYQLAADGQPMYLHQDHQGSTRMVTAANGTVRETLSYDQTGAIDGRSNPWIEQPILGYTGQQHDLETGFLYLRARYYDPTTSQFLSLDPLVSITREPYGYAGANPANRFDPSGLCTTSDWACIESQGGVHWPAPGRGPMDWVEERTSVEWGSRGAAALLAGCEDVLRAFTAAGRGFFAALRSSAARGGARLLRGLGAVVSFIGNTPAFVEDWRADSHWASRVDAVANFVGRSSFQTAAGIGGALLGMPGGPAVAGASTVGAAESAGLLWDSATDAIRERFPNGLRRVGSWFDPTE
jgi:RHS repeat-associated protein